MKHEHKHTHELKYCEQCDLVYCAKADCFKEWKNSWVIISPYYSPNVTWQDTTIHTHT